MGGKDTDTAIETAEFYSMRLCMEKRQQVLLVSPYH